jgi:dihydroorotate dehydrogenase electron transfer subunit
MMIQQTARILWNRSVAPGIYHIGLSCRRGYDRVKPGQFVMLRVSSHLDPLLRRPFSVHRPLIEGDRIRGIELLYKIVGKGTALLAGRKAGETLDVLGPLGSAFLLPTNARKVFVVAGGIGVAPLVFLAEHLIRGGLKPGDCRVFIGGRNREELLCRQDFAGLGLSVITTTDDGSDGDQCLVTHPVEVALGMEQPDVMFACGPEAMLKCVVGIAHSHGVECQVSIESRMACGVGACLGCAVEARDRPGRYHHVCLDGPVFDVRSIVLDP